MHLNTTINASEYDEDYDMALVYCFDRKKNYCFSLTRSPDEEKIEVMVLDQINCKVDDLAIELTGNIMVVRLEKNVAEKLDGHSEYTIELDGDETAIESLVIALKKIFEGKNGLILAA